MGPREPAQQQVGLLVCHGIEAAIDQPLAAGLQRPGRIVIGMPVGPGPVLGIGHGGMVPCRSGSARPAGRAVLSCGDSQRRPCRPANSPGRSQRPMKDDPGPRLGYLPRHAPADRCSPPSPTSKPSRAAARGCREQIAGAWPAPMPSTCWWHLPSGVIDRRYAARSWPRRCAGRHRRPWPLHGRPSTSVPRSPRGSPIGSACFDETGRLIALVFFNARPDYLRQGPARRRRGPDRLRQGWNGLPGPAADDPSGPRSSTAEDWAGQDPACRAGLWR